MAWYLAPALAVGRAEVDKRWPARDRTSEGTIGDRAHQQTRSDHNANERESVDAWDMDKDGVDVWAVIGAFQRHPSSHYWIYNREIADRDNEWKRVPYTGPNPHTLHVHFSIRQTATAEQDRRPWGLLEEDFMAAISDADQRALIWRVEAIASGRLAVGGGPTKGEPVVLNVRLAAMEQRQNALTTAIAALDDGVASRLRTDFDKIAADEAATLAAIQQAAAEDAVRDTELRDLIEAGLSGERDADEVLRIIADKIRPAEAATPDAQG